MPAHTALLSTSTAGRSPSASSAFSQATATSILFGPDAGVWPESLKALRWGWGIAWGEADLVSLAAENARSVFSRRPRGCGSKLSGLELRLGRRAVRGVLRSARWFSSSAVYSSGQSRQRPSSGELRGGVVTDRSCHVVWIRPLSQAKFQSPEPE